MLDVAAFALSHRRKEIAHRADSMVLQPTSGADLDPINGQRSTLGVIALNHYRRSATQILATLHLNIGYLISHESVQVAMVSHLAHCREETVRASQFCKWNVIIGVTDLMLW